MRVALVAWNALSVVDTTVNQSIGGLETFAWLLTKEIATHADIETHLVMWHASASKKNAVAGVSLDVFIVPELRDREFIQKSLNRSLPLTSRLATIFSRDWATAIFRSLRNKLLKRLGNKNNLPASRLPGFLDEVPADAWIVLGGSAESCQVVDWCISQKKPVFFWIRSNAEADPAMLANPELPNTCGVPGRLVIQAMQSADELICQTHFQQEQAQAFRERPVSIIPNPVDPAFLISPQEVRTAGKHVLWIGRADTNHKRPLIALEAARKLPEIPFVMVLNGGDSELHSKIQRDCPPNVQILPRVSRDQMREMFLSSHLFLSTGSSQLEGFPNVLLEAAATGTPIVSCEDFDHFLQQSQAGEAVGTDPAHLAEAIHTLWNTPTQWQTCSNNARHYVTQKHNVGPIVNQLLQLLQKEKQLPQQTEIAEQLLQTS